MCYLTVFSENSPDHPFLESQDCARVAAELAAIGVHYQRWVAEFPLPREASDEDILRAYRPDIEALKRIGGYHHSDVMHLTHRQAGHEQSRRRLLQEHWHQEDEVRLIVRGKCKLGLHSLAQGRVYHVVFERNDLVRVPAGTLHWFDIGTKPDLTLLRIYSDRRARRIWRTGSDIAERLSDLH